MALEGKVDDIFFVDADQEWEPQWILKLLKHPVDCVGAAVRLKTDDVERYNVRSTTFPIPVDEKTGLWKVDAVGTGFLRMSRRAMGTLWANSEPYQKNDQETRMVFDVRVVDGKLVGEDVICCLKLTELGIPVWIDPSFCPNHIGVKKYVGDFVAYIERLLEKERQPVGSQS
jgi:hypothetical protein